MKETTKREWEDIPKSYREFEDHKYELYQIKYIMSINDNIEEHNNLMKQLIEILKNNKE